MSRISVVAPKPSVAEMLRARGATLVASTPRQRAELLDGTSWCHRLSWKEEEGIGQFLQLFSLPPGTVLFREGESDPFASIIVEGALEIQKGDSTQQQHVMATLGVGKLVGEMSLIDGRPRSASAVSRETSRILVLSRDDFDDMVEKRPDYALKYTMMVAEAVAQLLRQTTGLLVDHLDAESHPRQAPASTT